MAISKSFIGLRKRLGELRRTMLPSKFSATGSYSERVLDRARGYRILVHAEIEDFVEDSCKTLVDEAVAKWISKGEVTSVILTLLASYHSGWYVDDTSNHEEIIRLAKSRAKAQRKILEIIQIAKSRYFEIVASNNGIKDINLTRLCYPIGIDLAAFDSTWIPAMTSFGSLRGDVAHKSKYATLLINPEDDFQTVKTLLVGLKEFDKAIQDIRKTFKS